MPQLDELLAHPTVKPSAEYNPTSDAWRVVLTEEVSRTAVAELTVIDDTSKVEGIEVYPVAHTLTYPDTTEAEAIKVAAADPKVRKELSNHGPYTTDAEYEDGEWTVHFETDESGSVNGKQDEDSERKEIAQVGVDDETWQLKYVWTGDQVGWQMARGDFGAYGKQANYWYVWGPLAFIFALAFLRTDKLFSMRNLDIVVLLSFLVSHGFFRAGEVHWAVLLWYPPLLYLLGRTLLMGFGIGERVEQTSNLPTPVLFVLGALTSGFVLALNLNSRVIDVGYASVAGADLIMDGTLPYGNMPNDVQTGDTYGPLNYLLYIPFRWLFGYSGEWDYLPAAHAMTALAFVTAALALLFTGWKYAGLRCGAALLLAWVCFPYTLYSTNNNTNDVIVAAVAAIGLATAASPLARGMTVGAGFAIKLFPLVLAPLWMLHDGRKRSSIVDVALGGIGIVLLTSWVFALDGDPVGAIKLFYEKTLAFQSARESPWTIFTQLPVLSFLQRPLTGLATSLALLVALFTIIAGKRTVRRLAAFSAGLIVAFQLTFNYWFYPYITWLEPFVFLALLPATNQKTALDGNGEAALRKRERPQISEQQDDRHEPPDRGQSPTS